MTLVPFLFLCIGLILLGAVTGKPLGYVVVLLAVLAMLIQALGPRL